MENQSKLILPYNDCTKTLQYRRRLLISNNQDNPIAWEVSKIEDTYPPGVLFITLTQDLFDPVKDNKELMVADYYETPVEPQEKDTAGKKEINITFSGKPEIKVGGGYKTFSYEADTTYTWNISGLETSQYNIIETENKIKIKVVNDYNLIGSIVTLSLLQGETIVSTLEVGVVSL